MPDNPMFGTSGQMLSGRSLIPGRGMPVGSPLPMAANGGIGWEDLVRIIPGMPEWVPDVMARVLRRDSPGPQVPTNGVLAPGAPPLAAATNGMTVAGCQVTAPVEQRVVHRAPAGYVTVTDPATGERVGMLRAVARACGLWSPRRKPPISASDWRTFLTAERVQKRLDRVVQRSNRVGGKAPLRRVARATRARKC